MQLRLLVTLAPCAHLVDRIWTGSSLTITDDHVPREHWLEGSSTHTISAPPLRDAKLTRLCASERSLQDFLT